MKHTFRLLLVLFLFQSGSLFGNHLIGGELTWQCQPNGQFIFTLKIYRNCNQGPGFVTSTTITSNSPVADFPVFFSDTNDLSPVCNTDPSQPHITCDGASTGGTDTGAIQEIIYQSNPITIAGVPPVGGWTFYHVDCCRSDSLTNLVINSGAGVSIRASMYNYNGRNTYPCFDSSPQFFEKPSPVYCSGGFQNSINPNAADVDLDSVSTEWAEALGAIYAPGYGFDNPLPDSTEDSLNVQALINPVSGQSTFTSFTNGTFILCMKTSSWKNGVLVSEIFRENIVIIKGCRPLIANSVPPVLNEPPNVAAPFNYNGNPSYVDTVFAGDTVQFQLGFTDFDMNPDGTFQTIHLVATGQQFSNNFTNTTACLHPPCATMLPDPITTSGQTVLNHSFNWVTSCDHLLNDTAYQVLNTVHHFVFKVLDDFCPIPGLNLFTVSIVILPPPGSPAHPDVFLLHDTLFCSVTSDSYQWFLNDTVIPGANSNYYIPAIAGRYSVQAIPISGCPAKSSSYAFTPVGIYFPDSEMEIHVSPNPFHHNVNISATGKKPVPFQVCLMDALGQTILSWNHSKGNPDMNEVVELSFLPAGIYLLQFRTESAQKTFRIVKMD